MDWFRWRVFGAPISSSVVVVATSDNFSAATFRPSDGVLTTVVAVSADVEAVASMSIFKGAMEADLVVFDDLDLAVTVRPSLLSSIAHKRQTIALGFCTRLFFQLFPIFVLTHSRDVQQDCRWSLGAYHCPLLHGLQYAIYG